MFWNCYRLRSGYKIYCNCNVFLLNIVCIIFNNELCYKIDSKVFLYLVLKNYYSLIVKFL